MLKVLAVLFSIALAPATAFAQQLKIGYVDVIRVMEQSPQAAAADKRIRSEFEPRDAELQKLRDRVRKLEDAEGKDAAGHAERERELFALKRQLKRASQELREDYNIRRNEELQSLRKLVEQASIEVGRSEGYDLVLEAVAIYASDRIDISEKILKRLQAGP
jgi:outer membrane protein